MTPPETRYARSGDLRIAYQVVGSGSLDLVFVPGAASNVDIFWEAPPWANFFSRLAAFSRLILFDKRGTGLSDRIVGIANLEERMDDVRAVMDAVGSHRASLFGISEGGPMSLLFAATYPSRVQALVLYGCYACHPALQSEGYLQKQIELIDRLWGTGDYVLGRYAPNLMVDEAQRRAVARFERQSASPSAMIAIMKMNAEIDARHILPTIQVPTLVIHRERDSAFPVDTGRYLARNIPNAKYVELPGENHFPLFEPETADRIVGEIEEFLTGSRSEIEIDRVLATVMFTDIVDSTKRAAALGDRDWRAHASITIARYVSFSLGFGGTK
jgi:pimeloyl-ACP methyl ester carboxylesterase